jgi:hypothetical protein
MASVGRASSWRMRRKRTPAPSSTRRTKRRSSTIASCGVVRSLTRVSRPARSTMSVRASRAEGTRERAGRGVFLGMRRLRGSGK